MRRVIWYRKSLLFIENNYTKVNLSDLVEPKSADTCTSIGTMSASAGPQKKEGKMRIRAFPVSYQQYYGLNCWAPFYATNATGSGRAHLHAHFVEM